MTSLSRGARAAGILLAIPVAAYLLALAAAAASNLPILPEGSCARDEAGVPVFAEFDVPNGPALAQFLPELVAGTPEITDPNGPLHQGPLHVVVFAGRHDAVPAYPALPDEGMSYDDYAPVDVVCIVRPDGDPWYFSSVDLTTLPDTVTR